MCLLNLSANYWTGPKGLGHIGVEAERVNPTHPDALALLAHCEARRPPDGLLAWASIAPRELLPLLPSLLLAEPAGDDWRYRLFGTGLVARCGVDWSNRSVRQVYNAITAEACARMYRVVADRREPVHLRGRYLGLGIEHALIEAVHIPVLGRDGETVWVFGGVFFHEELFAGLTGRFSCPCVTAPPA